MLQLLPAPPLPPEYCFLWAHLWWPGSDPWWACMQKAEWSGWVQAFGSIAAIIFAGWIARRQIAAAAHASAVARFESALVMEATISALATHVLEEVHSLAVIFGNPSTARDFVRSRTADTFFVEAEGSLRTISMQQLPSDAAVNRLVGLLKAIKTARNSYATSADELMKMPLVFGGKAKMLGCVAMVEAVKNDAERAVAVMKKTGTIDTVNSSS